MLLLGELCLRDFLYRFGSFNSTAGSLAINAGSGDQIVNLATTNAFSVGGEVSIDLGAGADEFTDSGNDVSVGGDFTATGVNTYINNSVLTVGGAGWRPRRPPGPPPLPRRGPMRGPLCSR